MVAVSGTKHVQPAGTDYIFATKRLNYQYGFRRVPSFLLDMLVNLPSIYDKHSEPTKHGVPCAVNILNGHSGANMSL